MNYGVLNTQIKETPTVESTDSNVVAQVKARRRKWGCSNKEGTDGSGMETGSPTRKDAIGVPTKVAT